MAEMRGKNFNSIGQAIIEFCYTKDKFATNILTYIITAHFTTRTNYFLFE